MNLSNAEARMGQLDQRLNAGNFDVNTKLAAQKQASQTDPTQPNFKAIATAMNLQMLQGAFDTNGERNSNDSPFGSAMGGGGMGGNPFQMLAYSSMLQAQQQQVPMLQNNNPLAGLMSSMPTMSNLKQPWTDKQGSLALAQHGSIPGRVESASFPIAQGMGKISSHFGHRTHPVHDHEHQHLGVDIAAKKGEPIKAPWDAEVVYVGYAQGFGPNTVIMAHPEIKQADGTIAYSIFGHNEDSYVKVGEHISKDAVFASVGDKGVSTGAHVHWEVRFAQPGIKGRDIFKPEVSYAVDPLHFA